MAGEDARKAAKEGRRDQQRAQNEATNLAISQERRNAMAERKANRKKPNIAALLATAEMDRMRGVQSTMLAGPTAPALGNSTTLLGG
jgi:hypothetical protein